MDAARFLAFLDDEDYEGGMLDGKSIWLVLVLVLLGGLAMNLTPCVLPMVPINLMVIGKSAARGMWYGAGIAVAYGALGVLAAVGGMAFGEIQSSPLFNGTVAAVFVLLALALFDVFFIDLSKFRKVEGAAEKRAKAPLVFAFSMGALSAVLAGACVAPILISVLLLTADLFAKGNWFALGLPFVMGVGMALPWPFAGAGMQVLPKPGAWMKKVNIAFGVLVLCFAAWYAYLAVKPLFAKAEPADGETAPANVIEATPETFAKALESAERPVLVDCWASWCKNCAAMERVTMKDPKVVEALKEFTVIRLQAEDIRELKALDGFEAVMGLPAFLVIE
jgi:thiol:disulfide interchange protein